jgi:hypothetical protein
MGTTPAPATAGPPRHRQGQRTDLPDEGAGPGLFEEEGGVGPGGELAEKIPQVQPGEKTRETAARKAGFGNNTTYRQAKAVTVNGAPWPWSSR